MVSNQILIETVESKIQLTKTSKKENEQMMSQRIGLKNFLWLKKKLLVKKGILGSEFGMNQTHSHEK